MQHDENTITQQQACYYLTFNVVDWIDIFIRPVFKQIIVESLNYFIEKKGLKVYAWCLMSNHLHLMAQAKQGYGLSLIAHDFKKFTGRIILEDIDAETEVRRKWILERFEKASRSLKLLNKYQVWQTSINPVYIDLDNTDLVNEQLDHIHTNPVRDRIVSLPKDYLYSSARDYAGIKGLVNVQTVEQPADSDFILRNISSYRHYH
ncbi:MAG: transposase [Chitinophagaceae bacterium]